MRTRTTSAASPAARRCSGSSRSARCGCPGPRARGTRWRTASGGRGRSRRGGSPAWPLRPGRRPRSAPSSRMPLATPSVPPWHCSAPGSVSPRMSGTWRRVTRSRTPGGSRGSARGSSDRPATRSRCRPSRPRGPSASRRRGSRQRRRRSSRLRTDWTRDAAAAPSLTDAERRRLVRAVETSADQVAFGLDRAINNTSLVCLFTYGDRSLLFPGDAHYGSWAAWLELDDAAAILAGLDFYKVSHHGARTPPHGRRWRGC